jgi:hypothetical protein
MKGDPRARPATASTQLGYLEAPILARFSLLPNAPVQPSLFVGPSLAFNLSAHAKLEGEGGAADIDVKDQVAGFDFGLVAGGGLGFVVGGKSLGVDLRYSRGLGDVGDGACRHTTRPSPSWSRSACSSGDARRRYRSPKVLWLRGWALSTILVWGLRLVPPNPGCSTLLDSIHAERLLC